MSHSKIRIQIEESRITYNGRRCKRYSVWERYGNCWVFSMHVHAKSKSEAYDKYNSFFCGGKDD